MLIVGLSNKIYWCKNPIDPKNIFLINLVKYYFWNLKFPKSHPTVYEQYLRNPTRISKLGRRVQDYTEITFFFFFGSSSLLKKKSNRIKTRSVTCIKT